MFRLIFSKTFWLQLILAALFIVGIVVLTNLVLRFYTKHNQEIAVPDLMGLSLDEAKELLDKRDLRCFVNDSSFIKNQPPGAILAQEPFVGDLVKENRRIYLTTNSSEAPKVIIPNLIDASLRDAQMQLSAIDIEIQEVIYVPYNFNVVLEMQQEGTKIQPGAKLKKGESISLKVGDGIGQQYFKMPNLIGRSYAEVRSLLGLSGLKIGSARPANLIGDASSYVIKQQPITGTEVKIGSFVEIELGLDDLDF